MDLEHILLYTLPPLIPVSPADLTNLISQLPPPFIVLGDFNAKNILWGAVLTDERGRSVHDVCAGFDLILLNTGAHMHLCLGSGTSSVLDLAFCNLGLAVHLDWSVLPDLHGSGHYHLNASMPRPNVSYAKPSTHLGRPLSLVSPGPHVQMSYGTKYGVCQVNVIGP
jgi:hypothetical protein